MREILFRGKRLDNGEWVYGDLLNHYDGGAEIFEHKETIFVGKKLEGRWYFVDSKTISQFTGLYDRNDVKIFEGDIVRYVDLINKPRKDKIIFVKGKFALAEYWFVDAPLNNNELEVIGNIYDNPDLLELEVDTN